ncbi:MAG: phosphoribosylformylglycinamidine cyclo-ligase, partial [Rhodothermales bacterium]
YSLARKVLFSRYEIEDRPQELSGKSVGEALLAVHRSYLAAVKALTDSDVASAFVHVTGGGIPGNTARVMPEGLTFDINWRAWARPELFKLIQSIGDVPEDDMRSAFNLGIGLIAVVPKGHADKAMATWREMGESPVDMGRVVVASET